MPLALPLCMPIPSVRVKGKVHGSSKPNLFTTNHKPSGHLMVHGCYFVPEQQAPWLFLNLRGKGFIHGHCDIFSPINNSLKVSKDQHKSQSSLAILLCCYLDTANVFILLLNIIIATLSRIFHDFYTCNLSTH